MLAVALLAAQQFPCFSDQSQGALKAVLEAHPLVSSITNISAAPAAEIETSTHPTVTVTTAAGQLLEAGKAD
ncbi:uncharacterized protein N7529_007826 [Penicillium soppii]|uniref:uncharacterized protein n=1 Tax=Penicillium soppii TaxID=69789 RepID=UPI0025495478|nr:uncharacterized protein N7529_007826 [Penicillium soppii]KAJ5860516.1 hypothetical protein N7529_007826 [Penicillium soppii]